GRRFRGGRKRGVGPHPAEILIAHAGLEPGLILRLERGLLLTNGLGRVIARHAAIGYPAPLAGPIGISAFFLRRRIYRHCAQQTRHRDRYNTVSIPHGVLPKETTGPTKLTVSITSPLYPRSERWNGSNEIRTVRPFVAEGARNIGAHYLQAGTGGRSGVEGRPAW